MTADPRYRWIGPVESAPLLEVCEDCGCVISTNDRAAHTRFHAILSDHGRAAAMLMVAHVAPHVHDKYDVKDRFDAKRNENNWSSEAFEEVVAALDDEA